MSTPATGGYVDPKWADPQGPHDAHIIIYGYVPNLVLCILGIVLFSLAFLGHIAQVFRYRYWSFIPLSVACVMEVIGYIFRLLSSQKDPYNIIDFVVAYFFIVTAPVLISASIYVCLTKLIRWANTKEPEKRGRTPSFLNPKLVLWIFITADVITTIVQITGAALIGARTSKHKNPSAANDVLLVGLAFQSLAFIIFLFLFFTFVANLVKRGLFWEKGPFIIAVATSSIFVFVRTLFRLAETSQGVFGYLSSHEAFFGGLECAPVVLAVLLLAVWHPGRWIAGVDSVGRAALATKA